MFTLVQCECSEFVIVTRAADHRKTASNFVTMLSMDRFNRPAVSRLVVAMSAQNGGLSSQNCMFMFNM